MQVGYVRVSTAEQNTARQEFLMRDLGVERVFVDHASGKDLERPELKKLLEFVREGDLFALYPFCWTTRIRAMLVSEGEK